MKLRKNKKGFTLIEIIVVLVIMGILLAIAVPSIFGYVNKARNAQYVAEARSGYLAAQTIVANEAASNPDAEDKALVAKIVVENITKELGETTASTSTIFCNVTSKKITGCTITTVNGGADNFVNFTSGKGATAEVSGTATHTENTPK